MRLLLRAKANPSIPDPEGRTPLHLAAASGDKAAARLLVEHGAGAHATDAGGKSPASLAQVLWGCWL